MRVANLVRWILLAIVLAFPVLVWGQNDNDLQDNPSASTTIAMRDRWNLSSC